MSPTSFSERLSQVPTGPGVYIMRNAEQQVIYVGKAANLRSRMRSYFGSPASMEPKTRLLSESIADYDCNVSISLTVASLPTHDA